jgi:TRAP-type C4-dicarboxylate transport system permease small subunit
MRLLGILARWVARVEDTLLAVLGLGLLAAAAAQLVFRVLETGPVWLDPLMRTATLWLALIGALVATRERRQLHIDVLARRLPGRLGQGARILTAVFTSAVCVLLAQASWTLVELEREGAGTAFAGLPNWWLLAILPLVFVLMAMHSLGQLGHVPAEQTAP